MIPADVFETRVTNGTLRGLVRAARAASMNMLRVWGGGRYFHGEGPTTPSWHAASADLEMSGLCCGQWDYIVRVPTL